MKRDPRPSLESMNSFQQRIRFSLIVTASAIVAVSLLAGCVGMRTEGEKRARQDQDSIGHVYRPGGEQPALPTLEMNAPLHDFLLFAMLNQPQVEAAYYDWAASVQRITVERSLPDPRLTFQSDIADMVMSLMPGLMMDFPGPGKLKAAANVATAESEAKYFAFASSVLQTAFAFKKAYYQLNFLDAKIGVTRETLRLMGELEKLALIQNEVGKVTLQDVLRARIEQERLTTGIANLDDSRQPLLAQFKASLGLKAQDATPPVPQKLEATPLDLTAEMLFATALTRNPRLKAMEAEVRLAEASLRLATKTKVPDFSAGIEADVKAYPVMMRPSVGVTLPIWRNKIVAQIAGAQAGKRAAEARLSAEQIALAVEFAEKSFMFREASRNVELLHERLLTMARQSLEVAQSGYVGGKVDFLNVIDAERTLLDFQLSEVEARLQRELALAELSLLILGVPPANAPVLQPNAPPGRERKP
jgi:cobalt-zinc-cadmium efflux system outer membrane protein